MLFDNWTIRNKKFSMVLFATILLVCVVVPSVIVDAPAWVFSYCGSLLGILSAAIIFLNYFLNPNLKGTSFDLLMFRTLSDLGLAVRFLFDPYVSNKYFCGENECKFSSVDTNKSSYCGFPSATFEFFEMASEAWFLCLAIDLLISLSNPFSSFKSRLIYYSIFSWSYAIFMALIVGLNHDVHGFWFIAEEYNDTVFCWIRGGENNYQFWVLFYLPIIVAYVSALASFKLAYDKLRDGITSTFDHRIKALIVNSANIVVFFLYWSIMLFLYLMMQMKSNSYESTFYKLLMFGLGGKAYADLFVWIVIVDGNALNLFQRREKTEELGDFNSALRAEVLNCTTAGIRESTRRGENVEAKHSKIIIRLQQIQSPNPETKNSVDFRNFLGMIFNFGEEERGGRLQEHQVKQKRNTRIDLDPDVKNALSTSLHSDLDDSRDSVSTTLPMRLSNLALHRSSSILDELPVVLEQKDCYLVEKCEDSFYFKSYFTLLTIQYEIFLHEFLCRRVTDLHKKLRALYYPETIKYEVIFEEYEPFYFRKVRSVFGVDDSAYIEEFTTTVKERLTEGGASGAFFFFSRDEKFVAKSCTPEELANLRTISKSYSDYMCSQPASYITRIYGVYMLRIYGASLYFFVMNNLFLTVGNEPINEKYDIKGSSVNRNASLPKYGNVATCTFCNQKFIYTGRKKKKASAEHVKKLSGLKFSQKCSLSVRHEPAVVMKDNDLRHKLRLLPRDAVSVKKQLESDSTFLMQVRVMDYSLLLGVHTREYFVDSETHSWERRPSIVSLSTTASPNTSALSRSFNTSESDLTVMSNRRLQVSKVVGPESYYIGIVDFLQTYNSEKMLERYFKIYFLGADPSGLSCTEPNAYKKRFMEKIDELIQLDDDNSSLASVDDDESNDMDV